MHAPDFLTWTFYFNVCNQYNITLRVQFVRGLALVLFQEAMSGLEGARVVEVTFETQSRCLHRRTIKILLAVMVAVLPSESPPFWTNSASLASLV